MPGSRLPTLRFLPEPTQTHLLQESHCCWEATRVRYVLGTADCPRMPLAHDIFTGQLGGPLACAHKRHRSW